MWLKLLSMGVKTASHIYQNKQQTKMLMSDAQRVHAERMAKGELEYQEKIITSNDKGIKDEIVLILVSIPFIILVYSVFSDDPSVKEKVDLFFQYFDQLPLWYQALFIGICSAIYGLKGADIFKKK
jgi:uncharacterized ion transporter superfamily protein YfcC